MIRKMKLLALAISPLILTACSSDDPKGAVANDALSTLEWSSCPENATLECATLNVPMDYSDDQSEEIEIALNRLPASQQPSTGVLLFNPGGPGGAGTKIVEILAEENSVPARVLQQYDLIGFDPRGTGLSTPVACNTSELDSLAAYLPDIETISAFAQKNTEFAESCHAEVGDYLLQLGSMNVVRDMESIRQALSVEKLNFIGYSYGTRLAALYLQNYPENSGAFVLDGSVRTDSTVAPLTEGALPVLQQNIENMLVQCSRTEPDCDPEELQQLLIDKVETLAADNNLEELALVGGLVILSGQNPAVGDFLIAPLSSYLLRGDTSGLETLVQLFGLDEDDESAQDENNYSTAQTAVLCADDDFRPTKADLTGYLDNYNTVSDLFAEAYVGLAGSCLGWPEAIEPLPEIATGTAPASLVIGGTSDAQTPLAWAEEMANAIGGYYLASSHEGHTVVFSDESECVDTIVTEFLINGQLPTTGDCLVEAE